MSALENPFLWAFFHLSEGPGPPGPPLASSPLTRLWLSSSGSCVRGTCVDRRSAHLMAPVPWMETPLGIHTHHRPDPLPAPFLDLALPLPFSPAPFLPGSLLHCPGRARHSSGTLPDSWVWVGESGGGAGGTVSPRASPHFHFCGAGKPFPPPLP